MAILTDNNSSPRLATRQRVAGRTPRDLAMKKIIQSYRRKILKHYPSAKFDEALTLGCSVQEFGDRLESEFREGMTWENYGEVWCVVNTTKASKLDFTDPRTFYAYFNADKFVGVTNKDMPPWLQNIRGYKSPKPIGFVTADGNRIERPNTL